MSKPKPVPDSSSRESPAFWRPMIQASYKRRERVNTQFERYSRWLYGDLSDVVDVRDVSEGPRWASGLENMLTLATTASLADLFFRYPQWVVKAPDYQGHPVFTEKLAKCAGSYLRHSMKRARYFEKARRSLQDCLLSGMGILKITADNDLVVDQTLVDAARIEAQQEIQAFLESGIEMKAKEGQIHSVHIDIKGALLNEAERGQVQLPRPVLKYIRKHLRHHAEMKKDGRPTETIRSSQLRILRVNPLDYAIDPTADDRSQATWRADRYLLRMDDVLENDDYDKDARQGLKDIQDRWESRGTFTPGVKSPGSYDLPEKMVAVWDVYDFIDQKRRLFSEDGEVMLLPGDDREDLAELAPSGPYEEIVFVEDAMEGQGIPPPSAFEAEQSAATHLSSANVKAALQSCAKTLYNARDIDAATAKKIWESPTGEFIGVEPKGAVDKALEDCFAQVPAAEIKEQNMLVLQDLIHGIERRSGLSAAKLGGGEQSSTATGAALGAEASAALSEDRGSRVDEWSERVASRGLRLIFRYTPKAQVVEVCGPEALEAWPDSFGLGDASNDCVNIIPGSSRRRNTAVDSKQILDQLAAFTADPMMQGPAAGKIKVQMYKGLADDAGQTGYDWGPLEQEVVLMAEIQQRTLLMQAQAMMMGPQPGAPGSSQNAPGSTQSPGGPSGQPGPGSSPQGPPAPSGAGSSPDAGPTQPNDLAQGSANVAGGQVGTGASIGDKVRRYRDGAVSKVMSRG